MPTMLKPERDTVKKVDIPLTEVYTIQKYFRELYRTAPMIGGRAVNMLSLANQRPTHDIDIAVPVMNIDLLRRGLRTDPTTGGEYFTISFDGRNRPQVAYFSDVVSATLEQGKKTGIEIDIYYPGYRSAVNAYSPAADIVGIPIRAMMENTQVTVVNDMEFEIISPVDLTILKFQAWLNRGMGDVEAKDMKDVQNIFRNQFGRPEKFEEHIWNVKMRMDQYRKSDARVFFVKLLEAIDYDKINVELKDLAVELQRKLPP